MPAESKGRESTQRRHCDGRLRVWTLTEILLKMQLKLKETSSVSEDQFNRHEVNMAI